LFLGALLGGCAVATIAQRTTLGPTAEEVWKAGFTALNNRGPSFDERRNFEEQLDAKVREYLARNPGAAYAPRAEYLRFWRRIALGMTKEEVTLLLGKPQEATQDRERLKALAREFWPLVAPRASEGWSYPAGWTLYFDGDALADITQHHRAFLVP
jgi:hypothetical protein